MKYSVIQFEFDCCYFVKTTRETRDQRLKLKCFLKSFVRCGGAYETQERATTGPDADGHTACGRLQGAARGCNATGDRACCARGGRGAGEAGHRTRKHPRQDDVENVMRNATEQSLRFLVEKWLGPGSAPVHVTQFGRTKWDHTRYVRVETSAPDGLRSLFFFRHDDGCWCVFPPTSNRRRPVESWRQVGAQAAA